MAARSSASGQSVTSRPSTRTRPEIGLVEPLDEGEHSGLAGARGADECCHATGRDAEADAAVDLGQLGAVAEPHLVEGDRGGRGAGPGRRDRGAVGLDRELLGLADAGDRGSADLVLAWPPRPAPHRRHQVEQVQQEGDEGAHVDRARGDPGAADAEHGDERHLDGQPGGVAGQRLPLGGAHALPARPGRPPGPRAAASRCSAPEALTVRIAPRTRSRAVPIAPTDSWARLAAR